MSDTTIIHCRSCGQEVEWAYTVNDKRIPLDFGTLEELYELVTKAAQGTGGKVRAIIMTAPAFDRYKELLGEPPEKAKAKDAKA